MVHILTSDAYRGFSAWLTERAAHAEQGAQPTFVGRVMWPGTEAPQDAVIKLYAAQSCGVANEVIGYTANAVNGIAQPKNSAVLLLQKETLPPFDTAVSPYIDAATGIAVCWATSLEQNARPFRYVRRLSTFSPQQVQAFYKSRFSQALTGIDHITGNNDRHEGNFLYRDDLNYLAIDQGNVGGSIFWHTNWPEANPRNELLSLVQKNLTASQLALWHAQALTVYQGTESKWNVLRAKMSELLAGLLTTEQIDTITDYMDARVRGNKFQAACGALL